jgi:leucyl aminopeptidase
MGRAQKYSPEQIVNLLRQIEVAIANGKTHPVACREVGITEQTYYGWRKEYGGLKVDQAKRLKELEQENGKLKRLVAELSLESKFFRTLHGETSKGITFDTGGISIKSAKGMEEMKSDMAGGAAMIGAMRAIALLKPKVKVTAIICATENIPFGKAQKPGDMQIAMSGKSIEVINTDAEGRLVLADGLCYVRQLGCTHLVDAATLTGAVVTALSHVNAGIFASDDQMYDRLAQATKQAGEKMWRLPLDDKYKELTKSNIADMVNSGGRGGGTIAAAMFLKEFAENIPWVHLDIAGTALVEEQKPWIAKGPTGIAMRSLVEFVKCWAA